MNAAGRPPRARTKRRWWRGPWAGLLAVWAVTSGCQDPNRMFFGLWEAEVALPDGWVEGRPELAIGQYGTELTGVVRYLDDNGLPTLPCRCAFLDHQRVDLDDRRFVAVSEQCDESLWIWELSLVDDEDPPMLEGTVTRANQADESVSVRFVLVDRFVPGERRVCVP